MSVNGMRALMWLFGPVGLTACAAPLQSPAGAAGPVTTAPPIVKRSAPESSMIAPPVEEAAEPERRVARCPEEMALIARAQGAYCIDRFEASLVQTTGSSETPYPGNRTIDGMESKVRAVSVRGRKPQGYISGKQADFVCRRSGKRLCELDEWVVACRGSKLTRYPYGDRRQANTCNDRYQKLDHHPVPILWKKHAAAGTDHKLMWHPSFMNDPRLHELPRTVLPTGSREACTNDYGVYDMVGNLHEWVDDPSGTFMGGFFMDTFQNGEGCEYRTTGHGFDYHDYSTGFRCCADPEWVAEGDGNLAEPSS